MYMNMYTYPHIHWFVRFFSVEKKISPLRCWGRAGLYHFDGLFKVHTHTYIDTHTRTYTHALMDSSRYKHTHARTYSVLYFGLSFWYFLKQIRNDSVRPCSNCHQRQLSLLKQFFFWIFVSYFCVLLFLFSWQTWNDSGRPGAAVNSRCGKCSQQNRTTAPRFRAKSQG